MSLMKVDLCAMYNNMWIEFNFIGFKNWMSVGIL